MAVILKENNLIYTFMQHNKFLGSSAWRYDEETHTLFKKNYIDLRKQTPNIENEIKENVEPSGFESACIKEFLRVSKAQLNESILDDSLKVKTPKRRLYKLNKKKVREKCNALFGLKQSKRFMAFITVSFPVGFPSDMAKKCLNTFFTRCRDEQRLKTYVRVSEYQDNGTIHYHIITNNFMQIRDINRFMAKAIETQIKKHNIQTAGIVYLDKKGRLQLSEEFDAKKYNGVDVKRCDNNKKRLNQYLTKYVSKNKALFETYAWHCSRDISELFTAQSFTSVHDPAFSHIRKALPHIKTLVVDNEFCTIEYLCQLQDNGKYFNPPDSWYSDINELNQEIYNNFHSSTAVFDKLPLEKFLISS